ncbi:unnamed protein product [Camellia sinensis]
MMDSGKLTALTTSVKDHISTHSNDGSKEITPKQPFIIGVAGGTASGKTTVCNMIVLQLRDQRIVLVSQDSFYYSLNDKQLEKVHEYNFDHPDAFNTELLLSCMEKLKHGQAVNIPNYDVKSHKCVEPERKVNPSDVIILEGILVLQDPRVRDLMNMKIFVDTDCVLLSNNPSYDFTSADSDVRLARRIQRDTTDRERNIENVLDQYTKFVKPSFDEFILPSKKHADIIIPRGADNDVAIDLIVQHIRTKLGQHDLWFNFSVHPGLYVGCTLLYVMSEQQNMTLFSMQTDSFVVEHGLGHLPFTEKQIITPTEDLYILEWFSAKGCVGSQSSEVGESMENALRACCKGIKIGKILIHGEGNNGRQLIYEKLPADISSRNVLLLDPVLASGNSAIKAVSLLLSKGVAESNIIFLNLIAAPEGIHAVCKKFPKLKIVTSEIDMSLNKDSHVIPGMGEFGDRYFGTDNNVNQALDKTP